MPTPQIGYGTTLSYSTDNGSTYTSMGKIQGFTPAKVTVAKVSIDAMDNGTFNGLPVEDAIPGWVSPGTYGVKLYYLKTLFGVLRGLAGTVGKFKVIKSDGSGYTFAGFIMEVSEEIPLKEAMTCDITIQINGGAVAVFAATQS